MGLHNATFSLGQVPVEAFENCVKAMNIVFRRQVGEFQVASLSKYTDVIGMKHWTEKDKKEMKEFVTAFRYGWEAKEAKEKKDEHGERCKSDVEEGTRGEGLSPMPTSGDGGDEGDETDRDD